MPRPWAETVKAGRRRLGLTQEQAARLAGVTKTTWARWEQTAVEPTVRAIRERVREILGVKRVDK